MSAERQKAEVERILVALDASPNCQATLEAAIEMASRLEAELIGIYVEDINLLRLAELPFAREIGYFSASMRALESSDVERQLRAHGRWARRIMTQLAEEAHLRWSFRVARGAIAAELLAATFEADLVILGRAGWSGRRRLGSTAQIIVRESPRQTLILQYGAPPGMPLMVAYDGSEAGKKALAAVHLVGAEGSLLSVLLLTEAASTIQQLQSEVNEQLGEAGYTIHFHWMMDVNATSLISVVRMQGCGMLILPVESKYLRGDMLLETLNEIGCAVLLVR